jgi:hypothetical protein
MITKEQMKKIIRKEWNDSIIKLGSFENYLLDELAERRMECSVKNVDDICDKENMQDVNRCNLYRENIHGCKYCPKDSRNYIYDL